MPIASFLSTPEHPYSRNPIIEKIKNPTKEDRTTPIIIFHS